MGSLDWHGTHISKDETELVAAFSYFNKYVDKKSLKKDFKEAKKKIEDGLHPVSKQALIKVGSFMAYALKENLGEEKLQIYYKNGPLPFFSDYIKISKNWPSSRKSYKFPKSFAKLITSWEKDWKATYTDYVRNLLITVNTDFDELGPKLKRTFSGANLYPDFSRDMEIAGYYYLWKDEIKDSFKENAKGKPLIKCLIECPVGEKFKVLKVNTGYHGKRRLAHLGMLPGILIIKRKAAPFRGPIEVNVLGSSLVIGRGLASKIIVINETS